MEGFELTKSVFLEENVVVVVEIVDIDNSGGRYLGEKTLDEVAADETGSAGDEDVHVCLRFKGYMVNHLFACGEFRMSHRLHGLHRLLKTDSLEQDNISIFLYLADIYKIIVEHPVDNLSMSSFKND